MAAFELRIFWLHFWIVARSRYASSILELCQWLFLLLLLKCLFLLIFILLFVFIQRTFLFCIVVGVKTHQAQALISQITEADCCSIVANSVSGSASHHRQTESLHTHTHTHTHTCVLCHARHYISCWFLVI